MTYQCCDEKFEDEKKFKKHIRSRNWHKVSYSNTFKLNMNRTQLINILRNPKILFGIGNVIVPLGERAILYLPFDKIEKVGLGTIFKRSIVGILEGPRLNFDMIEYRFTSSNLIYDLSFRVKRVNEEQSELLILSTMSINIGLLGRLMPGQVIKALGKIITPQLLVDEYLGRNLSYL
ncbi:MAG: hypothetical protein QXL96_08670 [Ignisphaera sp.]